MAEDRIYLTVAPDPKGRGLLAIISQGQPQEGDVNVVVLTLEVVKDEEAANAWYQKMVVERPWEARN